MKTKDTECFDVALTVPNSTVLHLCYFKSDIERCKEVKKKLESHPEIREYCLNHSQDDDVIVFLELLGNFILGTNALDIEMNEYPNIINIQ